MRTIYKYPFTIGPQEQIVELPSNAIFRHVGLDPTGQPSLWYEVDTLMPKKEHVLAVYGTGHEIHPSLETYLGSFNQDCFVWHIYIA